MKKIIIMAFIILLFPSIFLFAETESGETPNQWDKNQKTGSESFTVYFDLNDTDTSDLYSLAAGDNVLLFTADSGASSAKVSITFNESYVGVLADGV